jgi:tRNA(fMet)-specific endonuclease VapC
MPWLLDTNAWIYYLKNANSPIAERIRRHAPAEIKVCSVVRAELLHGAMKYGVPERRLAIVADTLAPYESFPFDDAAAIHYASIRHQLEQSGNIIGSYDLMIAAICVSQNCVLVTSNTREFSRIPGLLTEDWTAPLAL